MIKILRKMHLYLGCLFAPMMIFFTVTGVLQTFNLHHKLKASTYTPPPIVESMSEVHMNQRWSTDSVRPRSSIAFKYFVLAMGIGFVITTLIGIIIAFQMTKKKAVIWVCLLLGIIVPAVMLMLAHYH